VARGESRGVAGKFTATPGGRALEARGHLWFTQAGRKDVPAGSDSFVIQDVHVGPSSLALVTLQGQPKGIHVVSAEPRRRDALAVHFSAKIPAGGVTVGYLIVDALE
jgi:hypothetical protein